MEVVEVEVVEGVVVVRSEGWVVVRGVSGGVCMEAWAKIWRRFNVSVDLKMWRKI